jgi:ribosomal protein S12 methylthiotransferase accessory factor
MSSLQQQHYKDRSPEQTVEYIKEILNELGIKTTEIWDNSNEIGTFSLRVAIQGSNLGSNGKGISKAYARASAYAELMERYQNMWLTRSPHLWENKFDFEYFLDESYLSAEELIEENSAFIRMYFNKRGMDNASPEEKAAAFKKAQRMDFNLSEINNRYLCFPFYNANRRTTEYIPYFAYSVYYASNGMCAGNTAEEALVQGLSEILERHVQKRIISEHISLPDIPEDVIRAYPAVYELFSRIKQNNRYHAMLKDCSLGGRYPAAALVIIEKDTGCFGIKIGCHPDYGIAMERTITEAAQGNNIYEYVRRSRLDLLNQFVDNETNILNGYKTGQARLPYELLLNPPAYEYTPVISVHNLSNSEILHMLLDRIMSEGYEVLIRDVSVTGFPSFHIIIPGFSEVINMSDTWFCATNTKHHIMKLLNRPSTITCDNCKYIINVMDYFANSLLENTMRSYYGVLTNFESPAEEFGLGWLYCTAMCHVLCRDYKKASERISLLLKHIGEGAGSEKSFYQAVHHYLIGMDKLDNHERIINYLRQFYNEKICDRLSYAFEKPEEVMIRQYPEHNCMDFEKCAKERCCDYHIFKDITDRFKEMQLRKGMPDNLERLFS